MLPLSVARPIAPIFMPAATATKIPLGLRYGNPVPTASAMLNSTQLPSVVTFHRTVVDFVTIVLLAWLVIDLLAIWVYYIQSGKKIVHCALRSVI